MRYDKVIIGSGLYGCYAALFSAKQGDNVLVLECEGDIFTRATYVNQARVHMGYHYPRSISTALKSKGYFERFCSDYSFCIMREFEQIYATSEKFSWTTAEQFAKFCNNAKIRCDEVIATNYFKKGTCDGAYLTTEYTFDAEILRKHFIEELGKLNNVKMKFNSVVGEITKKEGEYLIQTKENKTYTTKFILNATYASINQIHSKMGFEPLRIKYELCEIIICKVNDKLKNTGITVMDGPFFSLMPFGKTEYHSLTSVAFTPHYTSNDSVPTFNCQLRSGGYCNPEHLGNCNNCVAKPQSAWKYMSNLARKYLKDEYKFEYVTSLYSMKPILKASEIDDSRPTIIRKYSESPTFISVLSGKINTVYDLDEVLRND